VLSPGQTEDQHCQELISCVPLGQEGYRNRNGAMPSVAHEEMRQEGHSTNGKKQLSFSSYPQIVFLPWLL